MFESLFIGEGYCKNSFPLIAYSTSICVVITGVVRSSRNVRQL